MVEWLALNASVSRAGEQMGCLFRLSRVASSEAEFPPEPRPREGLSQGGLERGGDCLLSELRPLPSSEAEMECAAGGLGGEASSEVEIAPRVARGPRLGRTAEAGRGPSAYWASLEPGEDLGVVEELEELRVQSDDGVVIVVALTTIRWYGDFFLSRITIE